MHRDARYYAQEAWREVKFRHRVYSDRIQKGKMTAATAALKIQRMREVVAVFLHAALNRSSLFDLRLPIREFGPGSVEIVITDLTSHIAELRTEARLRQYLLRYRTIDREIHEHRLELMVEMLEILQAIQIRNIPSV
jgi:hypothetical protein